MIHITVTSQETEIRMSISNTRNPTKAFIIPPHMNGAKDLKNYIDEITIAKQRIRDEFDRDLKKPNAIVEKKYKTGQSHNFRAEMAAVEHRNFIYERQQLNQKSAFLQEEERMNGLLSKLDGIRMMLVTNKQMRKTTVKTMKGIIYGKKQALKSLLPPVDIALARGYGIDIEQENRDNEDDLTIIQLKNLINTMKQNHQTIARNLLEQARTTMMDLRRHIIKLKLAAENTINEIVNHAKKCRTFIANLLRLDLIEYCATVWWFDTQKDSMDQNQYYVSVVDFDSPKDFDASRPQKPSNAFPQSQSSNLKIQVRGLQQTINREVLMHDFVLDKELEETILTEEAVQAFVRILKPEQQQEQEEQEEGYMNEGEEPAWA